MQQIARWLEDLGLRQYAQRFADNDIDFDILSDAGGPNIADERGDPGQGREQWHAAGDGNLHRRQKRGSA